MKFNDLQKQWNHIFAETGNSNDIGIIPDDNAGFGRVSKKGGFPQECFTDPAFGGSDVYGQDFQALFQMLSKSGRATEIGQLYPFDAQYAQEIGGYPKFSRVILDNGKGQYVVSTIDDNMVDPANAKNGEWTNPFELSGLDIDLSDYPKKEEVKSDIASATSNLVSNENLATKLQGYQPVGNYQPAGDYATNTGVQQQLLNYQPAGHYLTSDSIENLINNLNFLPIMGGTLSGGLKAPDITILGADKKSSLDLSVKNGDGIITFTDSNSKNHTLTIDNNGNVFGNSSDPFITKSALPDLSQYAKESDLTTLQGQVNALGNSSSGNFLPLSGGTMNNVYGSNSSYAVYIDNINYPVDPDYPQSTAFGFKINNLGDNCNGFYINTADGANTIGFTVLEVVSETNSSGHCYGYNVGTVSGKGFGYNIGNLTGSGGGIGYNINRMYGTYTGFNIGSIYNGGTGISITVSDDVSLATDITGPMQANGGNIPTYLNCGYYTTPKIQELPNQTVTSGSTISLKTAYNSVPTVYASPQTAGISYSISNKTNSSFVINFTGTASATFDFLIIGS